MDEYVSLDFETFSTRNLPRVGVYNYAECPHFRVLCAGYRFGKESTVSIWEHGQPCPPRLRRHVENGGMIHAWNAQFERVTWAKGLPTWPKPSVRQFRCTMVRSLACGLPGKLELAALALKTATQKDMLGNKAMRKLTKPRKVLSDGTVFEWPDIAQRSATYQHMLSYCKDDVGAESQIGELLPYLDPSEDEQYWYDQLVADRGVPVDQVLCRSAISIANTRAMQLEAECRKLTNGVSPTQSIALRAKLETLGAALPNLRKETVEEAIKDDTLPAITRRVLTIRREAAKTSTKKFQAALTYVTRDGTLKGMRQFYGAHTGRWAGRGVQLDNMLRTNMKDVADVVHTVKRGNLYEVELLYGDVMEAVANTTRSMIVASEGHALYVGDFKSIESRVLAYQSGQQSVLDAWRLSDLGQGPDVYVVNAAGMFALPVKEVDKDKRYWGKIAELSLGFQGGVGALQRQTEKNNVYFRDIYNTMYKNADEATRAKVSRLWQLVGKGHEKDWRAARFVVEKWRKDNPRTVRFWYNLQAASVAAMQSPGISVRVKDAPRISYRYDKPGRMLYCKLLSGRELRYPFPRLVAGRNARGDTEPQLRVSMWLREAKRLVEYHPYGGFLAENTTQATARDTMVTTFEPLERNCFKLLHTIHDELITQGKHGVVTLEEFKRLTTRSPKFMPGFPLAIDAWTGPFYLKKE